MEFSPSPSTAPTAPPPPTDPVASTPPKSKALLIASLILKLMLLILIFVTIGAAIGGIFSGDGSKQFNDYHVDKKKYEARNGKLRWSQEDAVGLEYLAFTLALLPLCICVFSCVLQCAVLFGSKRNSTPAKIFSFGDTFLCFIGLICLMSAGAVLLHATAKHCDKERRETLEVWIPTLPEKGHIWERWGEGPQGAGRTGKGRSGDVDDFEFIAKEDTLIVTVMHPFTEIRMRYQQKCSDRWNSGAKIAAGVIGIIASLLFAVASVFSLLEGLGIGQGSSAPQNASQFQGGAYQPVGDPSNPPTPGYQPSATPSYAAAANPPPQYQQGYQGQVNPGYVPAQPPQYQTPGYQGQAQIGGQYAQY